MKLTFKPVLFAGATALLIAVGSIPAQAKDAKAQPTPEEAAKAMQEAAKPGPEHAKLQPLEGTFTYTAKFWMDPTQAPVETTGTIERKWALGNRFLEERVKGTDFEGKPGFEGFGLIGYDNAQKKYTYTWASNMGTGTSQGLGVANSKNDLSFETEAYCPIQKKTIHGRDEIRIESKDKFVMEMYHEVDGKEVKAMELVATRKK